MAKTSTRSKSPSSDNRLGAFVGRAKRMVRLGPLVAAASPIPLTVTKLLPAYAAQRTLLVAAAGAFNFLICLYLFFSRHALARWMFARRASRWARAAVALLPLAAVLAALACFFGYLAAIDRSLAWLANQGVQNTPAEILERAAGADIPNATTLALLYIGMFAFAETAFIVIALREYMQDVLGYDERELGRGAARESRAGTGR